MFGALVLTLSLAQPAAQSVATVFVFTTTDCPIANRYAPEIQRLAKQFEGRVRFVLVYPVAADTPEAIRAHADRFGYALETIRDSRLELVRRTGVTVTPEVAVLDAREQIVYRGRIDDRYFDFGKDRPEPTQRDLQQALEAVLAGRPVAVKETRAIGCYLSDLIK